MPKKNIKILEDKLANTEKEFFKESNSFKTKKDELSGQIKILKESLSKSQVEASERANTINETNKITHLFSCQRFSALLEQVSLF